MDNITNSLAEYSSTVNLYADQINGALLPVASILILTFFLAFFDSLRHSIIRYFKYFYTALKRVLANF